MFQQQQNNSERELMRIDVQIEVREAWLIELNNQLRNLGTSQWECSRNCVNSKI